MFVTIVRNPIMYTDAKETVLTQIAAELISIAILNRLILCTIRGLVVYETLKLILDKLMEVEISMTYTKPL